ncbi:hypothetical protein BDQ17DRAFT_1425323 [Cyathus striatus]|nr:hypothetical protein BDQ17DRAFT_1425323 [Cyathus striatus]
MPGAGRFKGRKSASILPSSYNNQSVYDGPLSFIPVPAKAISQIFPMLSQLADEEFEATRGSKRTRQERENAAGVEEVRRTGARAPRMGFIRTRDPRATLIVDERESASRESLYLAPKLKIYGDGMNVDSSSESDIEMEGPQRAQAAKKGTRIIDMRLAQKRSGARKTESIAASSSSSSDEGSSTGEEPDNQDEDVGILPSDSVTADLETQTRNMKVEDEDVNLAESQRPYGPAEMIYLDSPPPISIELPQIQPSPSDEMPEALIKSISKLILPSLLMQKNHRLPFLLRSLRKGFKLRCTQLGIPVGVEKNKGKEETLVSYEGTSNLRYETRISRWLCPLCELFGKFNTREMLAFHLTCDHPEVYVEWKKMEGGKNWNLNVLVPEQITDEHSKSISEQPQEAVSEPISSAVIPPASESHTDQVAMDTFDFPFVSFSPATPVSGPRPHHVIEKTPTNQKWDLRPKLSLTPLTVSRQTTQSVSTRTSTQTRTLRTGSSRTAMSVTAGRSTTMTINQGGRIYEDSRYPTPPPQDDLLGPSARPPYLPAESDYGGPTVYYSCRPGGPCLYDLLQTLPMEPFGVLGWAVIDREEEIYEADDIKDEYKIMHALWARWIMLNRDVFIANFYKGTLRFIDEYWKIIHRAAGWEALRYWLLTLVMNRFLTSFEVPKVLKHYEMYTGMDYW